MDTLTNLPGKMMNLQIKDKTMLYNSYMPFLEHGGIFIPTEDIFSLNDEVLLVLELPNQAGKKFLRTNVAWINLARTSANRPKGVGLAFGTDAICIQTKNAIENELGNLLKSDKATFTL
ncbi:PilZ domain-containing protein [Neisseria weaveri]|uniref:Type 4 pilus biogenesis protein n=1 Tax=Neisseria weaveri TaxID=28091 RepID=A0A3S4YSS5_9NEIS|nr:PilZ domain-containing protein [Neisseria weaveri]EGV35459.1 type IV pilus biogenesis protein PilZ [Neisseria weaveri ATCC 51223]EGV37793.1 type IV pilus biogenesis protein PilZ [Neisseria weaveri LMG 5135]SAY50428.1 type 4 pilus biogenesis protein [Neisseria weaveri]VEJ51837.1 type 4 pilus biogenesis protein [Neisseria weaveri]